MEHQAKQILQPFNIFEVQAGFQCHYCPFHDIDFECPRVTSLSSTEVDRACVYRSSEVLKLGCGMCDFPCPWCPRRCGCCGGSLSGQTPSPEQRRFWNLSEVRNLFLIFTASVFYQKLSFPHWDPRCERKQNYLLNDFLMGKTVAV